jgi:hypothetical protein
MVLLGINYSTGIRPAMKRAASSVDKFCRIKNFHKNIQCTGTCCGSFYLKFEHFSWKILIIEEESGVASRCYFSVGLRSKTRIC